MVKSDTRLDHHGNGAEEEDLGVVRQYTQERRDGRYQ